MVKLQHKTFYDVAVCKKWKDSEQSRKKWNELETTSNSKWNKEKHPTLWVINDTDEHSMVLSCM